MTSRRSLLAAALAAAFLSACGRGGNGRMAFAASKKDRVAPAPRAPVEATVSGLSDFGARLFPLVAEPTKNAVLSPLSIAYAFGMARVGARGSTAAEIDEVLGFPSDPHPAFNKLWTEIVTTSTLPPPSKGVRKPGDERKPPIVAIANGQFAQVGVEVQAAFLDTLAEQYGAGVHRVDFGSPQALELINAWVREQTADRIEKLFDRLPANTRLVLANAVYLKADWVTAFAEDPTGDQEFRAPGGNVRAPMMHSVASRGYAATDDWQAVELPYFGDALAMRVVVPTGEAMPAELLTSSVLETVADQLTETQVDLTMPKWDFATDLDLVPPLRKLGMVAPFEAPDFSGMLPGVALSQVVHRANITVDQWGTEAAAVTGISAIVSAPAVDVRVRVDRPFAFAIMHLPTVTPLFLGQVVDPTAT